jgi:hypothetical protein
MRHLFGLVAIVFIGASISGCQTPTFQLKSDLPKTDAPTSPAAFVEPIFEETELENFQSTQTTGDVTVTTQWQDKIWLVKPDQRRTIYRQMVEKLASQGVLDSLKFGSAPSTARVVRLAFAEYKPLETNANMVVWSCIAGAFFPLCPPLIFAPLYAAFVPIEADHEIAVMAKVFEVDSANGRMVDQPGFEYPRIDLNGARLVHQKRYVLSWQETRGLYASWTEEQLNKEALPQFSEALTAIVTEALAQAPAASSEPTPTEGEVEARLLFLGRY